MAPMPPHNEETLPTLQHHDDKVEITMVEDAEVDKDKDEIDVNSPEAILQRYPLLRNMSEKELDLLNRKVRRRIDIWMLPILTVCLMINYLDRSNVTNARVAGMQEDMNMTDVQLHVDPAAWVAPAFQVQAKNHHPTDDARLVRPYHPLPFVRSPAGFACARLAVGLAEGPFLPAVALMTSSWYVREELPFRMALWHGAQTISNVLGGPFAAAVLENMDGIRGMHAWEWFMIIEGALSIAVAIVAYWMLPNWANNTPWLTPEQTEMAQYRLVLSAGGHDEATSDLSIWQGAKMACKSPFTWLFMSLHFWLIAAQSFKDFLPSILRTLSKSTLMTYLLQSPAYLLGYFAILGFGYTSGRFKDSVWHVIGPITLSAVGTAMLISTMNVGVRYTGVCFLIMGVFSGLNIQVSWSTQLVPGPRHKKAAMLAIANTFGTASHWFTPYFFLTNQKPLYRFGGGLILVSIGLTIVTVLATRWYVIRLNRGLDAKEAEVNEERASRGREPLPKGWRYPL
ncbi:hypothetical protein IAU60_001923 [Kwoniella sp. DSM 27419]